MTAALTSRRRNLVNATDVAVFVFRAYHVRIDPARIRQWATRGHVPTHGFRRERYDLREVIAYARSLGLLPESSHQSNTVRRSRSGPGDHHPQDRRHRRE